MRRYLCKKTRRGGRGGEGTPLPIAIPHPPTPASPVNYGNQLDDATKEPNGPACLEKKKKKKKQKNKSFI